MLFFLEDQDLPSIDKEIGINDFVINTKQVEDIVPMSVGVVRSVYKDTAEVFFIGKSKLISINKLDLIVIDIYKTGKEQGTFTPPFKYKICNICHVLKNQAQEFEYNQNDKQGRPTTRPSCRDCRVNINGKKMPKSEKDRMNSIKPKDYELFECPICHKVTIPDVTANIVIDHDHRTGLAREWICDSCNTGIGRFQDSPEMLGKIAEYITKHNSKLE